MRLLIVNPSTSAGVTARIDAAAQAMAEAGDHLTTVSAASGPGLIVTQADAAAATRGVLQAIAAHPVPIDGVLLSSIGDAGAAGVRQQYPELQVMGISDALIQIAAPDVALAHDPADVADAILPVLKELSLKCAADGAVFVVTGGGPLAGVAQKNAACCSAEMVDATQAAVELLRGRLEER